MKKTIKRIKQRKIRVNQLVATISVLAFITVSFVTPNLFASESGTDGTDIFIEEELVLDETNGEIELDTNSDIDESLDTDLESQSETDEDTEGTLDPEANEETQEKVEILEEDTQDLTSEELLEQGNLELEISDAIGDVGQLETYTTESPAVSVGTREAFITAITEDMAANIIITADLDFEGYTGNGSFTVPGTFTGSIDGGNFAIKNLTKPMFETLQEARVEDMLITDAFITGTARSILATTLHTTEITNVHISNSLIRSNANNGTGPFAGTVNGATLTNISVTDTIVGGQRYLGGLFGLSYGTTNVDSAYVGTEIKHYETHAAGVVTLGYSGSSVNLKNTIVDVKLGTSSDDHKGGVFGQNASGTFEGVVVNTEISIDAINRIAGNELFTGSVKAEGTGVYSVNGQGGVLANYDFVKEVSNADLDKTFYEELGFESEYWNVDSISKGMPTLKTAKTMIDRYASTIPAEKAYINVSTATEFTEAITKDSSVNINLTDNLNFLLFESFNTAIVPTTYSGKLNGNGFGMLNLSNTLFASLDGAEVSNLFIKDAHVSGRRSVFAILMNNTTIQSVHIADSYLYSSDGTNGVGMMVGAMTSVNMDDVSITNCTQSSSKRSAFIAGYSFGTSFLSNIYIDKESTITTINDASGGMIGQNASYLFVENGIVAAEVNTNAAAARGGLMGYSTMGLQIVDVVSATTSGAVESIASNTPLLAGYASPMTGRMYEWSGSNMKFYHVGYAYANLLEDGDINKSFYTNTLGFDEAVWSITDSNKSDNFPTLKSFEKMIKDYQSTLPESTDLLKTVEEYDALIKEKYTPGAGVEMTQEVEYLALCRNLVNNVGYNHLLAYFNASTNERAFINWLFEYENIKQYTEAGEPDGGSYTTSMLVLYQLYTAHKEDLSDNRATGKGVTFAHMYRNLMFSISHTHATTVGLWVSKSSDNNMPNNSTGVGRYEIYKRMMIADVELDGYAPEESYQESYLDDIFYTLEMEEMRYVVNGIIDDESVEWFEWYVRTQNNNNRSGYGLISYLNGYNYLLDKYYDDEEYWDDKYNFKAFGMTYSKSYPKSWVVLEEGGVCGAISKMATNAQTVNGRPGTVVSQPGHAAYTYFKETDVPGDYCWDWIDTSLTTWAYTGKTERMAIRMPNGWGSDSSVSGYAASYLFISQAALNENVKYVASEKELLLTDVYSGDSKNLETIYFNALDNLDYNLDAWLGLARLYVSEDKSDEEKYQLLVKMADGLKYQPLPLHHVASILTNTMYDAGALLKVSNLLADTYTRASQVTSEEVYESRGVKEVAQYLLGAVNTQVASFTYDGENARKVTLDDSYEGTVNQWNVSIDCGKTWFTSEDMSFEFTPAQIEAINDEDDIRIYFTGADGSNPENHYIIDIEVAEAPLFSAGGGNIYLYANDLENIVAVGPDANPNAIQWYDEEEKVWKYNAQEKPDLSGDATVTIRLGASGTLMASPTVTASFTENTDEDTRKYVSIDRISIDAHSQELDDRYLVEYAIDGNINTLFHTTAQNDNYITLKVDEPIYLSAFEYTARISGTSNGCVYSGEIYTSMDGEKWTPAQTTTWDSSKVAKIVNFEEPLEMQYIKLVSKESGGNFLAVTMMNLFEDSTKEIIPKPEEETSPEGEANPEGNPEPDSEDEPEVDSQPGTGNKPVIGLVVDTPVTLYDKSQGGSVTYRVQAEFKDFMEVLVDGEVLDEKWYKVTEGSILVELSEEYLKSLEPGEYKVEIVASTGVATIELEITDSDADNDDTNNNVQDNTDKSESPDTSDRTLVIPYISLCILMLAMYIEVNKRYQVK